MQYRSDIDGLRAVAVLPVIFFHAGFSLFSGGFVGVDVFFVISGYLITTLIIEDIENNRFSMVNFYERRARRILPALFLVILSCFPFAWVLMTPDQLKAFSKSIVAVSLFSSNFLFWNESGYFDTSTDEKPLLHTWSLAVEEQYYLFFPIFLVMAWKFGRRVVFGLIIIMALVSLGASEHGWRNYPTANFYLAPSRIWELLAGSLSAFTIQKNGIIKNQWLSFSGLLMIVISIILYDEKIAFPSLYTLVPVIGAVFVIIFSRKDTFVFKILSLKPIVFIGLLSYGAYLWHQPILAFSKIFFNGEIGLNIAVPAILATFFIAYLSLVFLEKPIRQKVLLPTYNQIIGFSSIVLTVPILFGMAGYLGYITPRASLGFDSVYAGAGYDWIENIDSQNNNFVLFGDSHAKQYFGALEAKFGPGAMVTESACLSLPGIVNVYKNKAIERIECINLHNKFIDHLKTSKANIIFISQRWEKELFNLRENKIVGRLPEKGADLFESRLIELLQLIPKNKKIILIGNVPSAHVAGSPLKKGFISCLAKFSDTDDCPSDYDPKLREGIKINYILSKLALKYQNISFYDPKDALCDRLKCYIIKDNKLIYSDHAHLTSFGSALVVKQLFSQKEF